MDTDVVNAEVIIAVDHTKLGHICLTLDQDDTLVTDLDPAVEGRPHSAYECDASGAAPKLQYCEASCAIRARTGGNHAVLA